MVADPWVCSIALRWPMARLPCCWRAKVWRARFWASIRILFGCRHGYACTTQPEGSALARRGGALIIVGASPAGLSPGHIQVLELTDPHGIAAALALGPVALPSAARAYSAGVRRDYTRWSNAAGYGRWLQGTRRYGWRERRIPGGRVARQLRGEAGKTQVSGAQVALAQCLGGIGVTAATHILLAE